MKKPSTSENQGPTDPNSDKKMSSEEAARLRKLDEEERKGKIEVAMSKSEREAQESAFLNVAGKKKQ